MCRTYVLIGMYHACGMYGAVKLLWRHRFTYLEFWVHRVPYLSPISLDIPKETGSGLVFMFLQVENGEEGRYTVQFGARTYSSQAHHLWTSLPGPGKTASQIPYTQ